MINISVNSRKSDVSCSYLQGAGKHPPYSDKDTGHSEPRPKWSMMAPGFSYVQDTVLGMTDLTPSWPQLGETKH